MKGGCNFGGVRVNILMYANDIVLIAPMANSLQRMVANLEVYCYNWNLRVNFNKFKIMVLTKGGKLKNNEKSKQSRSGK